MSDTNKRFIKLENETKNSKETFLQSLVIILNVRYVVFF